MATLYGLIERFCPDLFARLKLRLSLLDLQRVTEGVFDIVSRFPETLDMFQALKVSDPAVDHSARWSDEFKPALETIASRATRKSQATECRKIILEVTEKRALTWVVFQIHDAGVRDALMSMFFPQLADRGFPNLVQLLAQQYLYYIVDGAALTVVYTQQFNSTVNIEKFNKHYDAMCKVAAEIMVKKVMFADVPSITAKAYQEHIVHPLEGQLESIKREFKENLYLLSPMPPNSSRFLEFLNKYSKQLETFEQASSISTGAV